LQIGCQKVVKNLYNSKKNRNFALQFKNNTV